MEKNPMKLNIVKLNDYKDKKRFEEVIKNVRIYDDIQEYCFVQDYEMIYEKLIIDNIEMGEVFATILEHPTTSELVAIQFPIEWEAEDIAIWMMEYVISFNENDENGNYILGASTIIEGVKFNGLPLVLARSGLQKLYYDSTDFIEITNSYSHFNKITNTENQKPI